MRRFLTLLHRWTGLVFGVLLVALGISGSALVYRADIERWQTAAFRSVTPLAERRPADDWVSAARAYVPRKVLARITFPANETDAAQSQAGGTRGRLRRSLPRDCAGQQTCQQRNPVVVAGFSLRAFCRGNRAGNDARMLCG